jgi:peptide/nickel transport system substrate-binding protein
MTHQPVPGIELSRRALLAGSAAALGGCDVSGIPADPRRLVMVVPQEISLLDPAVTLAVADLGASQAAYQRLLAPVIENGMVTGITGDLAESWTWAPDRSLLTIRLKPGQRFDDGIPVTADAVRFSFERIVRQKMTASQALFWLGGMETPDPLTVKMRIAVYLPFIEHMLWHPGLSIINPAVMAHAVDGDQGSGWLRSNSAGSGSYRIAGFEPRASVTLKPNPHSANPPRFFQEIVLRTVRDVSSRSMQMAAGDADIVEFITTTQARWLEQKPKVRLVSGPSASIVFLHLNTENPVLKDVRVRRAIDLAINREAIIRSIYRGEAEILHGLLPLGIPGSDAGIPRPRHDLGAARTLLKEAGVPTGTPLTITAVTDSGAPSATTLALREQLAELGLAMSIREVSTAARSQIVAGDFDMTSQSLSLDFPDPWIMFNFAFNSQSIGATNMSRYNNPELDALVARADRSEPEERNRLYQQAQRKVLADLPSIPLFRMNWTYAQGTDLAGGAYNFSSPQTHDFRAMYRIPKVDV